MIRWVRGSEVPITVKITNNDPTISAAIGTLVNIDSVKVNVWDQDGTLRVDSQTADNPKTGYYRYFADTAAAWALGTCVVELVLTASGNVRILKSKFALIESDAS